jgi:hypothetical protein
MNISNFKKTNELIHKTVREWWCEQGFSEYSSETSIECNNRLKAILKFHVEETSEFETEGEFVIDNMENRKIFLSKLIHNFPSAKLLSYESSVSSYNFHLNSAEIMIPLDDFNE